MNKYFEKAYYILGDARIKLQAYFIMIILGIICMMYVLGNQMFERNFTLVALYGSLLFLWVTIGLSCGIWQILCRVFQNKLSWTIGWFLKDFKQLIITCGILGLYIVAIGIVQNRLGPLKAFIMIVVLALFWLALWTGEWFDHFTRVMYAERYTSSQLYQLDTRMVMKGFMKYYRLELSLLVVIIALSFTNSFFLFIMLLVSLTLLLGVMVSRFPIWLLGTYKYFLDT